MGSNVSNILLVSRSEDEVAARLASDIVAWLEERGASAVTCEHRINVAECAKRESREGAFDLVLVLGGDGTFISVARRLLGMQAPVLGLDLGTVGFLTELHPDSWEQGLTRVLAGEYMVSRRLALEYDVYRDGRQVASGQAVNDLVISRGVLARLIHLGVAAGDERVSSFRADGLIISTPTGSTAYGVSAGGPVVHPEVEGVCVTPVCPFLNCFKPLVLPINGDLAINVLESGGDVNLTEDGQESVGLKKGDEIRIRRSGSDLMVAQLSKSMYFERLRTKGFLTEA